MYITPLPLKGSPVAEFGLHSIRKQLLAIIIQKFGGRLLETPEHIRRAAQHVIKTKIDGDDPVVVVSAPGSTTDRFREMALQITDKPDEREMDMMLSVGERTAMALLAMAINADGRHRAVSFTGSQVGIITDNRHTNARIIEVKCLRIRETLDQGNIPIIAGFQGISVEKEITTLGKGGSDATAVALAAALKAERCELIKENGAVFSADPELVSDAVPLPEIDYDTLEAISSAGAQVVQPHAASLAKQHEVTLSITDAEGTKGTLVTDCSLGATGVAAVVINDDLFLTKGSGADPAESGFQGIDFAFWDGSSSLIAARDCPDSDGTIKAALMSIIGWGTYVERDLVTVSLKSLSDAGIKPIMSFVHRGDFNVLLRSEDGQSAVKAVHKVCLENRYIKTVLS